MDVRLVRMDDAEQLRELYNREVLGSTVTFDLVPRSVESQRTWIEEHSGAYPAVVAVSELSKVMGFASLSPYRSRPAYSTTVEDSVYVHSDHQGKGIGKILLTEISKLGTLGGFHSIIARIVGNHDASMALHRSCGFEFIGVEKEVGRKFGKWLDVALFQRML